MNEQSLKLWKEIMTYAIDNNFKQARRRLKGGKDCFCAQGVAAEFLINKKSTASKMGISDMFWEKQAHAYKLVVIRHGDKYGFTVSLPDFINDFLNDGSDGLIVAFKESPYEAPWRKGFPENQTSMYSVYSNDDFCSEGFPTYWEGIVNLNDAWLMSFEQILHIINISLGGNIPVLVPTRIKGAI